MLVNYGGDSLAQRSGRRTRSARRRGRLRAAQLQLSRTAPFATADAVIVPSRFAADYYRKALGLDCTVLPNLIDLGSRPGRGRDPRYVTFVNPSYEKGVYAFARIADELGRAPARHPAPGRRGPGTEGTLVDCGIDLRPHGNVFLMAHTPTRAFWGVTRVCLMPSLWWENQPLVAVEAMVNGIPVIGSDRGGLPETLGAPGSCCRLPDRFTPLTRELPTPEEVAPWVEAIIRLWDDPAWYAEQSRRALAESRRWSPEVLEPQYVRFFEDVRRAPVKGDERSGRLIDS